MKISMWMIAEKLEKYQPKCAIVDGAAYMTGVRFISSEADAGFDRQYLYLSLDNDIESAILCNGPDMMILQGRDTNEIMNDLLGVFDFYNTWEKNLWEASARKSFQQIIDLADAVLENPMMVADNDSNVLAMSSAFLEEDINDYWIESRLTRRLPAAVLASPLYTPDGKPASWSDQPNIYIMPDGTKTIGTFLRVNGELIAGFGLWEHKRPIRPSDVELVHVIYEVLISTIDAQKQAAPVRSSAAILADLLEGVALDKDLVSKLELNCICPWRLIVIANPYRREPLFKRNLLRRFQEAAQQNISLTLGEYVVALVSDRDSPELVGTVLGIREKQYYQAVLSLPFEDLNFIRTRYLQILFALKHLEDRPGVYMGEQFAMGYLLDRLAQTNQAQMLSHPALEKLKQHDIQRGSELYDTLYQYLLHERSVLKGSEALHIHKNSFLYRMQRIREITGLNLEEPLERTYLLLSYLLQKTESQ